jgi:hypothetical protein
MDKLVISKEYVSVGTVSYPKKFGSIKFPITSVHLVATNNETGYKKDLLILKICNPDNIKMSKNYIQWCLDCNIMKPITID